MLCEHPQEEISTNTQRAQATWEGCFRKTDSVSEGMEVANAGSHPAHLGPTSVPVLRTPQNMESLCPAFLAHCKTASLALLGPFAYWHLIPLSRAASTWGTQAWVVNENVK